MVVVELSGSVKMVEQKAKIKIIQRLVQRTQTQHNERTSQ